MKTQHWIFNFSESVLGTLEQTQMSYRPSNLRAVVGVQRPTLTALYKARIRGLHPICNNDGRFIGHV